ncbi:MAG: homocysteine S-methyltransferase family protein, partial [Acidaminobacteraceae bacterium]
MNIFEKISQKPVYFDGAIGTVIQSLDIEISGVPEELNITNSEHIAAIHANYILSGCDIITTNTFGANSYKLKDSNYSLKEVVCAAIKNAKTAVCGGEALIAYDIGPIGKMMKPIGTLTFDEAYNYFKEQVDLLEDGSVDLVIIETMADLNEARAAILAVKENSKLPVFATMTFAEDGRTITGTTPEIMVACFEALGVDALGVNCSLGPQQLLPIIKTITDVATKAVIVQANAGIPRSSMGETVFSVSSSEYTRFAAKFIALGVSIIGGCCGTNYDYMRELI